MMYYKKRLVAASLMLVAASLTSIVLTSYASAQCVECAIYPNRDPLNGGAETPAGKSSRLGRPNGAVAPNTAHNAHAEMRGHRGRYVGNSDGRPR
jgi:hypothetical protein